MFRRLLLLTGGILLLLALTTPLWAPLHPTTRAAYNLGEYRLRRWWWDRFGMPSSAGEGTLSGWVSDTQGQPIAGALVLAAAATGETYTTTTDASGFYTLTGAPSGSYRPIAAAWGYALPAASVAPQAGPLLRLGASPARFDAILTPRQPPALAPEPETLILDATAVVESDFPVHAMARRQAITFTHAGAAIEGNLLYLPIDATPDTAEAWPLIVIAYPSPAINWDKATVQFAAAGHAVLAIGPDEDRGLDLEAHALDLRLAIHYAKEGLLGPEIAAEEFVLLSGSFGALYAYRALPDLQGLVAIVNIGGVSDAFLGVQALYDEDLAIPPPYDAAVAAMGRPDRDPGYFLAYSPAFWAEHHPPTLLIHLYEDNVIPHNQSVRLAEALEAAGVPHELYLYHSDTHYLDPRDPTPGAVMVFERVLAFVSRLPTHRSHK